MTNPKTLLLFGIVFAIGSTIGFLACQFRQQTEAVTHLQATLQHLERELAQKMGFEVSATNTLPDSTLDEAFEKAEALLKQGDLATAALYFNRSLGQNPGNWEKIHRYQQSVLASCRQLRDHGDYDTALQVLAEMETFLLNQALYLTVPNLAKLNQALTENDEFRQTITDILTIQSASETRQVMNLLLVDELGTPSTQEPQQLIQYINQLKANLSALQSLDTNFLDDTDLPKIARKIAQVKTDIATFEVHLVTAQKAATVLKLVQRGEHFLDKAQQEPHHSALIRYYLDAAESIIRQLVELEPKTETAHLQLILLSQKFDKVKRQGEGKRGMGNGE